MNKITSKCIVSLVRTISPSLRHAAITPEVEDKLDELFRDVRLARCNLREFLACQVRSVKVSLYGFNFSDVLSRKAAERYYAHCIQRHSDEDGARRLLYLREQREGKKIVGKQVFTPSRWNTIEKGFRKLIQYKLHNSDIKPAEILEAYKSEFSERFLTFIQEGESTLCGEDLVRLLRIKTKLLTEYGRNDSTVTCLLVTTQFGTNGSTNNHVSIREAVPEEDSGMVSPVSAEASE